MIDRNQAFSADEFHTAHAGLPCTVWRRAGISYDMPGGGFFLPIERDGEDGRREWHHITGVNADGFHVADECPRRRREHEDQPPGSSDRSEGQPMLDAGYRDADGYDALGYNEAGYDRNGYDADGYDRNGYDADGYDANGYNADGDPKPGSLDASDLDLDDEWAEVTAGLPSYCGYSEMQARQRRFREHLRSLVRDPDDIDELGFCGNCNEPAWDDDLNDTGDGTILCESCWDDWYTCDQCNERVPDTYETLDGSDVCESCREQYYSYCEYCDGYYPDDYAEDHEHGSGGDGCCESPQHEFEIRNGSVSLVNDKRITITLPAGTISSEGLQEIARCLRRHGHFDVSYSLGEIGDQWQTRQGNFTKRLSRLAHQEHQDKLTPAVLSEVGGIARNHSSAVDVTVEVSRDLNASAADWYHEDSCWWQSYYEGRCALKTNGGFGIRSFPGEDHRGYPSGRAWVLPLRHDENRGFTPTFRTLEADAFVVFNGYGDLSGYAPARILAHMAGWTYRKIGFSCNPMYINAGGYLVAPEHIAKKYEDSGIRLSVDQHSRLFETESEPSHA